MHARASVERRSRETRETRTAAREEKKSNPKKKIVTLRAGAREEEGKGGWGGEKKIRLPDIIVLLANSVRWQTEPLIGAA